MLKNIYFQAKSFDGATFNLKSLFVNCGYETISVVSSERIEEEIFTVGTSYQPEPWMFSLLFLSTKTAACPITYSLYMDYQGTVNATKDILKAFVIEGNA